MRGKPLPSQYDRRRLRAAGYPVRAACWEPVVHAVLGYFCNQVAVVALMRSLFAAAAYTDVAPSTPGKVSTAV